MGEVISYKCKKCGYESTKYMGVGMMFIEIRRERAERLKGKDEVTYDGCEEYIEDLHIDDPEKLKELYRLQEVIEKKLVKKNICPHCHEKDCLDSMNFGMWD